MQYRRSWLHLSFDRSAWFDQTFEHNILTPHGGRPEDVANVVSFLTSDEARYVQGTVVEVNGGMMAHSTLMAQIRQHADSDGNG